MSNRAVWINIHIPKCGGTTLLGVLQQNFREGFRDGRGLLDNYQFTAAQVKDILSFHPEITCYSDHKLSTDLPFDMPGVSITAMTLVRDPVDRFISQYFFNRNNALYEPKAKELSFDEYIDWALVQGNQPKYINGQTRFLTGDGEESGLQRIKQLIQEQGLLVFPLKRFDETCLVLESAFSDRFKDCTYQWVNKSKKDQPVTEEQRKKIAAFAGNDFKLVEIANAQLDELLQKHIGSEADVQRSLKAFRTRLMERERRAHAWQPRVKRTLRRIGRRVIGG